MAAIDPVVLFFILGLVAGLLRSDLRLPPAIYDFLVVLLLLAIGLKGGVELAKASFAILSTQIVFVLLMGVVLTLVAFSILRYLGRLSRVDAASIAAHFGSVSVGTFAVATAYLSSQHIAFESHIPLFVVLLEIPGIVIGVVLAKGISKGTRWGILAREMFFGKSIILLLGGLLIGWVAGPAGVEPLGKLFFDTFKGVLALFLLEMGLICATQMGSLRRHGIFLVGFGIVMPLLGSVIGGVFGWIMGLSVGGTMLLATLAASASYIAAPAVMRLTVPDSNPTLSLMTSLGVAFPFNVTLGSPLYMKLAFLIHSWGV